MGAYCPRVTYFLLARVTFLAFLAGALRVALRFAAGLRVVFLVLRFAFFAAGFLGFGLGGCTIAWSPFTACWPISHLNKITQIDVCSALAFIFIGPRRVGISTEMAR